jgi:hypothetical protein
MQNTYGRWRWKMFRAMKYYGGKRKIDAIVDRVLTQLVTALKSDEA